MATYYINSSIGLDSAGRDGSSSAKWATPQYACTRVTTPGDIIHVDAGTYSISSRCEVSVGVSIEGEGNTSILNMTYDVGSDWRDGTIYLSSYGSNEDGDQSISYLKLSGGYNNTRAIAVIDRNNVAVHHCTIENFDAGGSCFWGIGEFAYNNEIHNCNINDSGVWSGDGTAGVQLELQYGLLFHDNICDFTGRSAGNNGNILSSRYNNEGIKIYNNEFSKLNYENTNWNFFLELWHLGNESEIYNNTFNGNATIDIVSVFKGSGSYGLSIHDNDYIVSEPCSSTNHGIQAIDLETYSSSSGGDRMSLEDIYIYNNYFKYCATGVQIDISGGSGTACDIGNIFIFNNLFEIPGVISDPYYTVIHINPYGGTNYSFSVLEICSNTIIATDDNPIQSIVFNDKGTISNVKIQNNIIVGSSGPAIDIIEQQSGSSISTISVENNLYHNNGTDDVDYGDVSISGLTESNNVTGDPSFVSSTDFHLSSTSSPAYHAGRTPILSATDKDGITWNNPPSIGTYEYGTGSTIVPTVTTTAITSITQTTASSGGNVTDDGGSSVTARGVCWNTSTNPTIANSKTSNGTGTGSFSSSITGLSANTTYYARSYATNANGTSYGSNVSFTTLGVPTVTTQATTNVTISTAIGNGNLTATGNPTPTQHGHCWNTSTAPTTANSKTTLGAKATTGAFTSSITGLSANTTYYIRAYATNSEGSVYGGEYSFTTPANAFPPLATSNLPVQDILTVLGLENVKDIFYVPGAEPRSLRSNSNFATIVNKYGLSGTYCPGADADARLEYLRATIRDLKYFKGYDHNTSPPAYTDNFESYSLGNLGGQGDWVAIFNNITVASSGTNVITPTSGGDSCVMLSGTYSDDQYAQIKLKTLGDDYIGVAVRCSTDNFYGVHVNSSTLYVVKYVSGTGTDLDYAGHSIVADDVLKLAVSGSTLTITINDLPVSDIGDVNGQITDTSLSSGSPGVMGYRGSSRTYGDEFECTGAN